MGVVAISLVWKCHRQSMCEGVCRNHVPIQCMGHGNIAAEVRKDVSQRNTLECLVPCGDAGKTQPAALA